MSKPNPSMQSTVFCGIDVSAATLAAAVHQEDQRFYQRVFNNNAGGHNTLIAWLHKRKARVRVSLEATGTVGTGACEGSPLDQVATAENVSNTIYDLKTLLSQLYGVLS